MSLPEMRARLAEQQAALLQALTDHGPAPAGFAESRVCVAARALARKRCRTVARAWPVLARALGSSFAARFAQYAQRNPLPRMGTPLADGLAFARSLAASGELPDEGRLEKLAVEARYTPGRDGLAVRRGPVLKLAFLRERRRLVVVLRLPWLGAWWLSVPLGRRGQGDRWSASLGKG